MEIWVVGICMGNGKHHYRVFDTEREARGFAERAKEHKGIEKVGWWDLCERRD